MFRLALTKESTDGSDNMDIYQAPLYKLDKPAYYLWILLDMQ